MTAILGRGTCGAHLTLLFTVEDASADPVEQGSLGTGICVEDGIEAIARGQAGEPRLSIRFIDDVGDTRLYQQVLDLLCEEVEAAKSMQWELAVRMHLPISQGFGMSAAGAVAAACAFQRALGLPHEESLRRAFSIAHRVERANSTGLGDVAALAAGGIERRIAPGAPYSGTQLARGPGIAQGWSEATPVVLAWRENPGRHTSEYIDHPDWKRLISEAGSAQMSSLSAGGWDSSRWQDLIDSAQTFSRDSRLIDDASRGILVEAGTNAAERAGFAGKVSVLLCMLGESIVIVPNSLDSAPQSFDSLISELEKEGLLAKATRVGPLS